jgi:ADP-ribosylglycohydrolase
MTLFTGEGLVRAIGRSMSRGICSPPAVLHSAYLRWLATQTGQGADRWQDPIERGWLLDVPALHAERAPGLTCLAALSRSCDGNTFPTVQQPWNDSKGCGAVMRSAPIGLAVRDVETAFELGRDAGALTHGHPSGYLSAAYFAAVIHGVARDTGIREAMAAADELLGAQRGAEEVIEHVKRARVLAAGGLPSRACLELLGEGWVGEEALAIALYCAISTDDGSASSVVESLWLSVAHGGDSDSTGSLTGNLLGAMHGVEALPPSWVAGVELREVIERLAIDLHTSAVLEFEPDAHRYPPN